MGLPGMKKCLEALGLIYSTQLSYPDTRVYVDGNILLYITKEVHTTVTVQSFMALIESIESFFDYLVRDSVRFLIAFDGSAPYQKLPEQISRRKKRLEEVSIDSVEYFDLSNSVFVELLLEIEQSLKSHGWAIMSHTGCGEGEQKLANRISHDLVKYPSTNFVLVSKDWDTLLILLFMHKARSALYLVMLYNLPLTTNRVIDIAKTHSLITQQCSILHFASSVLLFGCDFVPGIGNLELSPNRLQPLLRLDPWASRRIKQTEIVMTLNRQPFEHALRILDLERHRTREVLSKIDTDFILYSNIDSENVEPISKCCKGVCPTCYPERYCITNKNLMVQSYLNTYLWTLAYFSTRDLEIQEVPLSDYKTEHVYPWFLSPYPQLVLAYLEHSCISTRVSHLQVASRQQYTKLLNKAIHTEEYQQRECAFNYYSSIKPRLITMPQLLRCIESV